MYVAGLSALNAGSGVFPVRTRVSGRGSYRNTWARHGLPRIPGPIGPRHSRARDAITPREVCLYDVYSSVLPSARSATPPCVPSYNPPEHTSQTHPAKPRQDHARPCPSVPAATASALQQQNRKPKPAPDPPLTPLPHRYPLSIRRRPSRQTGLFCLRPASPTLQIPVASPFASPSLFPSLLSHP